MLVCSLPGVYIVFVFRRWRVDSKTHPGGPSCRVTVINVWRGEIRCSLNGKDIFAFCFHIDGAIDYIGMNSSVTLTSTNQRQCINITVVDDSICEADEIIPVLLTTNEDPSEVMLNPSFAMVTIIDDDGRYT